VLHAKKTSDEKEFASTVLGGEKITLEEACVRVLYPSKGQVEF
jgi:hypothetical protein